MAPNRLYTRLKEFQPRMHGLAIGMTLSIGSLIVGQGCPLLGQCPACPTCAEIPRLTLLTLPWAADGLVLLTTRILKNKSPGAPPPLVNP